MNTSNFTNGTTEVSKKISIYTFYVAQDFIKVIYK